LRTACVDAPSGTTSHVGTEIASRVAKAAK
jgi:hypothetical protein